jgi:glyoxylase-like metal-dependent hydrolase (beta-lactamase superfamily II)/rhodanese-related sulfurtransferase
MRVTTFRDDRLGNGSYLLRVGPAEAVVVDPDRRVDRYLAAAEELGVAITATLESHLHADFVTGSLEIADRVGATILVSEEAGVGFPHRGVRSGERLELGEVEVEVRAVPGHAPEQVAYVVASGAAGDPPAAFTGGALIAGGAARTDLLGPEDTEPLTRAAFASLHAFDDLPDETELHPTHGGGSFCSAGPADRRASTIGEERRTNELLAIDDEERFVAWWPTTFPGVPAYFRRMRDVNRAGPRLRADIPDPPELDPAAFALAREDGALVVDARPHGAFAAGHVPGSLAIPFRDHSFATWLGWLAPADADLAFVLPDDLTPNEVVEEALLVGYERFAGVLAGGVRAWRVAGLPVTGYEEVEPSAVPALRDEGALVLDVREPTEFEEGHVEGAVHVPLGALPRRLDALPRDHRILVYCSGGDRSATAVSVLERHGVEGAAGVGGGYEEIAGDGG